MLATLKLPPWTLGERGFAGLNRVMSVFCYAAGGVVSLTIVVALILMMLIGYPMDRQIGPVKGGAHIAVSDIHINAIQRSDPACLARIQGTHDHDISTCMVDTQPTAADIASARKSMTSVMGRVYLFMPTLLWAIPMGTLAYGLFQAGACFAALGQRAYFAPKTVGYLRNFALAGLLFVVMFPMLPWLHGLVTHLIFSTDILLKQTLFKPPAGTAWAFSTPGAYTPPTVTAGGRNAFSEVLMAIYAFTVAILATVMSRASTLANDHAQII